jgi:predicted RNase H-like HicB family nuclease
VIHTHGKSAEDINRAAEEWIEGKMRELENRA